MKEEIKLLNFLRSQRFILYVALFSVAALAPNTYYVFYSFSVFESPYREIVSAAVAILLASAIMIFLVHKNIRVSRVFAYFEVMVACYYYMTHIGFDWGLIPAIGFACIQPYAVSKYTDQIDVEVNEKKN